MLNIKSCFDLVKRILSGRGACQGVSSLFFLCPEYDPTTVDCTLMCRFLKPFQSEFRENQQCCQRSHDANKVSALENRNRILLPSALRLASKTKMAANLSTIDLNLIWYLRSFSARPVACNNQSVSSQRGDPLLVSSSLLSRLHNIT